MRHHKIEEVKLGIVSKDANPTPKWYTDDCTMIRDVQKRRDGLVLRRTGQRVIAKPENAYRKLCGLFSFQIFQYLRLPQKTSQGQATRWEGQEFHLYGPVGGTHLEMPTRRDVSRNITASSPKRFCSSSRTWVSLDRP